MKSSVKQKSKAAFLPLVVKATTHKFLCRSPEERTRVAHALRREAKQHGVGIGVTEDSDGVFAWIKPSLSLKEPTYE